VPQWRLLALIARYSPLPSTAAVTLSGLAFPGFEQIPASKVALAYVRCLESRISGQTLKVC